MLDMISNFLTTVDDFVWGIPLIVLILATGLFLTARLHFLQITKLPHAIKHLIANEKSGEDGEVSSFAALCTALSATIGTGNIVGVATAIVAGGPGALFWMWIAALVGTATKYSECLLAVKYRVVAEDGHIIGGPFYYIENGMGKRTSISEFTCQNRGGKGVKWRRSSLLWVYAWDCSVSEPLPRSTVSPVRYIISSMRTMHIPYSSSAWTIPGAW